MMKWLLLLLLLPPLLWAEPLPRTVLALYNSDQNPAFNDSVNPIAIYAQMPLNWLGLKVRYHDIAKGLPSSEALEDVYALFSWFYDSKMRDPIAYIRWATGQIEQGKRLIIFDDPGCTSDMNDQSVPLGEVNHLLHKIGIDYGGGWSNDSDTLSIESEDLAMLNFERKLNPGDISSFFQITPFGEENELYLTLNCTLWPGEPIVGVSRSPRGGYAGVQLFTDDKAGDSRWYIDPFAFFNLGLGVSQSPRFDPTTLFGRRIAISHIDGDGVRNATEVEGFKQGPAGEVVLERILRRYWMPVSASFISVEVDPRYMGSDQIIEVAKEIFALDNVECASHTFSHPLDWKEKITTFTIPGYSRPIPASELENLVTESGYLTGALVIVPMEEYLQKEVVEAAQYLQAEIAPLRKRLSLLFWSGDCTPQEEALALCAEHNLLNINGGDSRFDRHHPSYTYVAAYGRPVGPYFQTYAMNANDEIYTNDWTGPFYGQRYLIETFQQTEYPTLIGAPARRVSGIDLYYHFFSGQKIASLNAIRQVLHYMESQPTIPLWTGEYCTVVNGWVSGKVERTGEGWHFSNYGLCRTVRFDASSDLPDLNRSKGVVGFTHWENYLYVTLAEGEATLYFATAAPDQPYLIEASSILKGLAMDRDQIEFSTRIYGPAIYRFANMRPSTHYLVTAGTQSGHFTSTAQGELTVVLSRSPEVKVTIVAQ